MRNWFREYFHALKDDPRGVLCGWCWRPNFLFDDIGFIYICPEGDDSRIACEKCFHGPLGQKHHARYGLGDR